MTAVRYARPLLVLLVLALIPTVIHSYAGLTIDDGRSTSMIPVAIDGYATSPGPRNSGWGRRRFETDDWFSRRYVSASAKVTLTAVRAYDLKALYHHPELAVAYDTPFSRHDVRYLPSHPDVPVHVLTGDNAVGLYVLMYADTFVADPVWFQLRTSGALLFSGRRPMTLLFAQQATLARANDVADSDAARVLFAAVDAYRRP
jgi:hypothetical protein